MLKLTWVNLIRNLYVDSHVAVRLPVGEDTTGVFVILPNGTKLYPGCGNIPRPYVIVRSEAKGGDNGLNAWLDNEWTACGAFRELYRLISA